ncbi:MAG: hypothetical protein JOY93_05925, partial [Acidobacteriales bacterium]|nr:hypothetical protein [Terriglobales bacterium]
MPTVAQKRARTNVSIAPLDLEAQPRLAPKFDAIPVAPKPQLAPVAIKRQRREMQAALVLLSVALLLVILKERAFWQQYLFPSETAIESTSPDQSSPDATAPATHSAAGAAAAPRSKAKP